MIAFVVGAILAVVIGIFAKIMRFDRDRSFYATVLIVIASYYILFSFISFEAIFIEIAVASVFTIIAVIGVLRWPLLLGIGILLHGFFDLTHNHYISNSGVPTWWPAFCAGVDIVLGVWVIYLIQIKKYLEPKNT